MRFHLKKCPFVVTLGKRLGYLIFAHGIKVNPDKIHALVNMKYPNSLKGIQQINGRIMVLNRFISNYTDKIFSILQVIKNEHIDFQNDECDIGFHGIKQYLGRSSILVSPNLGELLYSY